MNVKTKKIFMLILIIILIICGSNKVFATDVTNKVTISKNNTDEFNDIGSLLFGIVRVVGVISSVAALMLMGIKYMLGSIEEKAEYKKTFPSYIVGCILVFAITTLADIIYKMF